MDMFVYIERKEYMQNYWHRNQQPCWLRMVASDGSDMLNIKMMLNRWLGQAVDSVVSDKDL